MKANSTIAWLVALFFAGVSRGEDAYTALDAANSTLSQRIQQRAALQQLSPGIAPILQLQNAADQRTLDANQNTSRAVRSPGRGADDTTMMAMMMASQAQSAAAAANNKKSSDGGGSSQASSSPNPAFQTQTLQVPDAKFDTSVHDDKAPLLDTLQSQVADVTKALEQPVSSRENLPVADSIDQEIANIKDAASTTITLLKAQAVFAARAAQAARMKPSPTPDKSIADLLGSKSQGDSGKGGTTSGLGYAEKLVNDTTPTAPAPPVPGNSPSSGTSGHHDTLSSGHPDALSAGAAPSLAASDSGGPKRHSQK